MCVSNALILIITKKEENIPLLLSNSLLISKVPQIEVFSTTASFLVYSLTLQLFAIQLPLRKPRFTLTPPTKWLTGPTKAFRSFSIILFNYLHRCTSTLYAAFTLSQQWLYYRCFANVQTITIITKWELNAITNYVPSKMIPMLRDR